MRKSLPGYQLGIVKAGTALAVLDDACLGAFDIYLSTGRTAADQVVAAALKAIWENVEKLSPLHPILTEWTRERAVDSEVTIPYHPAAVQFYKERRVWSSKMDDVQRKLLAVNP